MFLALRPRTSTRSIPSVSAVNKNANRASNIVLLIASTYGTTTL